MKKMKCAAGGVIKGPRSMQEQLQNIRGRFADGGKIDPVEELMRKMSQKYGATPTAQTPVPQPSEPQRQPAAAAQPGQGIVGTIQRRNDELRKISDYDKPRGMQSGGIAGIDEPISLQDDSGYREPLPSAGVGAISSSLPAPTQSQGMIGSPDYSTGPKETGFVWEDGTRRDGLTPQQAQQQGSSVSPVATSSPPPLLTAAEKQIAAGYNPNAAYRPGGIGDPHASGGIAATAQQRASLPPGTPTTIQAPLQQPSRRSRGRNWYADGGMVKPTFFGDRPPPPSTPLMYDNTPARPIPPRAPMPTKPVGRPPGGASQFIQPPEYPQVRVQPAEPIGTYPGVTGVADAIRNRKMKNAEAAEYACGGVVKKRGMASGGMITPVNIGQGLYQVIAKPIAEDWRQGNAAIKKLRDQYPTADNLAGIHPAVAAAQAANDVMAGQVGADTAANVAQMIPIYKQLKGLSAAATKQGHAVTGVDPWVLNMPATIKKNMAITAGQVASQPANAFADGGMVRFAGKGGPREDKIPVKVAGESVRVSDGESAVILPAKTAANPLAVQAIGQIIRQSNDGRAPDMGTSARGAYKDGLTPADLAAQLYEERTGQKAPVRRNQMPATRGISGSFQSGATESFPVADPAGRTDQGKYPYTGQPAQNPYRDVSIGGIADAVTPKNNLASHPIYSGVSAQGMIDAVTPGSGRAPAPVVAPAANASRPVVAPAPAPQAQAVPPEVRPLWAGSDTRDERTGLEQERARVAAGQGLSDKFRTAGQELAAGIREFNGPSLLTTALVGDGRKPAPAIVQPSPGRGAQQSSVRKIDQASVPLPDQNGAWTGNAGNAEFFPNNGRLSFVSKGLDVHRQQLADGTGMMHRAGDGKTILFSNMSPNQYTAADGTPNARWEQTQAYIDAQNRLQADKLRIAEMQAIRQGMNPVQAAAATQGMAQAAQRAPLDRQVVQQQIDTGKVAAQNAKELQDLYAAHKASTDPAEQERIAATIRARTGKDKAQNYKAAVLAGAKTLEGSEAERGYLINEQTGEVRPLESFGSAPAAQQTKGLPAPKSISERDRLPSGTKYVAPDGQVRIKP